MCWKKRICYVEKKQFSATSRQSIIAACGRFSKTCVCVCVCVCACVHVCEYVCVLDIDLMNLGGNSLQNFDTSCLLLLVPIHTRVIEKKKIHTRTYTQNYAFSLSCSLAYTHTNTHTHTNTYKRTHTNTITHAHTLIQIHSHEQTHIHTCCVWCRITVVNFLMCVCVCACVCACVCVCACLCKCLFWFPSAVSANSICKLSNHMLTHTSHT